jgi:NAD(P)-dependent dehydrogenase (short-subunit alcohol dehydrogenase family)/acyl carrier protein
VSIDSLREQTPETLDIDAIYRVFNELGLSYGPAFQTIAELRHNPARDTALVRLCRRDEDEERESVYLADPTLVDGAFQSALSLVLADKAGAYLPVGIGELRLHRALPGTVYGLIRVTDRTANRLTCDIELFDEGGRECLTVGALECAALFPSAPSATLPEGDYALRWNVSERSGGEHGGCFVIIGQGADPLARDLTGLIGDEGRLCATLDWDGEGLRTRIMEAMLNAAPPLTLVLVFSAGLDDSDPFALHALERLLALVQELEALGEAAPRCALLTRGGMPQPNGQGRVLPAQAALVNFVRVVVSEHDDPRFSVIDLDPDRPDLPSALVELKLTTPPAEVALRAGARRVPELAPSGIFGADRLVAVEPAFTPWERPMVRLDSGRLVRGHNRVPAPEASHIELAFEAICLLPGDSKVMGFSGVVGRVGEGIDPGLRGRAIFGLAPRDPRSIARLDPNDLSWAERPGGLAPERAATLGPILAPALGLIERIGSGSPGHCLVVDTPYGGAIASLLEARGAGVIRLAANPEDWSEATLRDGKGRFDLIAAPLAAFDAHFPLSRWLARNGHLVDITEGAAAPFLLPAHARTLQRLCSEHAPQTLSSEALCALAGQPFHPVPTLHLSDWPGNDAAPRVLVLDPQEPIRCHADDALELRHDGTYLVSGGLGGLGQRTALWLADSGARRLVLLGRRGIDTPGASELVAELGRRGTVAIVLRCDVASAEEVEAAVALANSPDAPLRGVFHAAGALADRPITELTAPDIHTSMGAKARGAEALHRATEGLGLDLFVLYSSVAPLVGNKNQANYCAANGYLDALAHRRRAAGLPALSVNFGAIGEVGMAADPNVEAHLRQIGLPPLAPEVALTGVAVALQSGVTQVYVGAKADWSRCCRYNPRSARTDRLLGLCGPYLNAQEGDRLSLVRAELAKLGDPERPAALGILLAEIIAGTLGIDAATITPTRPLADYGLDSLISVEVLVAIESALGTKVSAMALLGDATIEKLARAVLNGMGLGADAQTISQSALAWSPKDADRVPAALQTIPPEEPALATARAA